MGGGGGGGVVIPKTLPVATPLVIGHHVGRYPVHHPESSEEQPKKVIMSADVQFSIENRVTSKKKVIMTAGRSLNFPQKFSSRLSMIRHVVTVHNAEKEDIGAFFNVLGGQTLFLL